MEKVDCWLPRTGGIEELKVTAKEYGVSFRGDKNILKLIMVMVAKLC